MSLTHLIPWLLDEAWRHHATHGDGNRPTGIPPRGVDRITGVVLEHRHAIEATR